MKSISGRSPTFDQATHLLLRGLDDTDGPVVVIDNRLVGGNRGGVAVLIDDACLRDVPVFDGWKV